MLKLLRLTILALLVYGTSYAQSCASTSRNSWEWPGHNNWFIGTFSGASNVTGKMIDFKAGFTKSTTGQAAINKGTPVYEGVTTASNDKGELVVFSNGRWAWDANSVRTSTGIKEGNEGGGNIVGSAAQGIICVRHPLNPYDYYIITVGDVIGGANPKMGYNIFGPDGKEKQAYTTLGVNATEGITATFHENGVDIWVSVLQYQSTTLHSFLLTCDGFVTPSVKTNLGYTQSGDGGRGGLAFSHDGTKFVACYPNSWPNADRQIVLYDFDKRTGKFSNRKNIAPTNVVIGPYDVVFSKDDSKVYVTGGNAGGVHAVTIANKKYKKETGLGQLSLHHAVEIGGDGNYYFNGKDGLWRWSGSGAFTKVDGSTGQGLPTMFIPPQEEPDIQEVGVLCDTSDAVNLETYWLCSGIDAEDTITGPSTVHSEYVGNGIIWPGEGIFDPKVAGEGLHQIIFRKCAVDDTIWIEVKKCVTCIDTLQNVRPEICAGQTVNLTALIDTSNGPGIWTIDSVPNSVSVDPTIDDSAADTLFDATSLDTKPGEYKVLFTVTKDGQVCADSLYIRVNKNPEVTVNDSIICAGDPSALFTATSDSAITTYDWRDNGTGVNATTSGTIAGDYTVKVTDQNGCVDSATGVLTVNALPIIEVNNDTICDGGAPGSFTATSDTAATTYLWGNNGSGVNPTTNGVTSGAYSVLVIDKNGCVGRDTGYLKVNVPPVVTVNDSVICAGDPAAEFTATVDSMVATYTWTLNGSGNAQTTTGTTAGDYTVTVVDVNGCEGSGTGVLRVNALPVISVNDSSICEGASSGAEFTASSDSLAISYLWSENGSGTGVTTSGTTAGNYTVEVTDVNGCISTGTGVLSINKLPVVSVNSEEICNGDAAATFTATVDSAVTTYIWSDNGSGNAQTATGTTTGDYTVTIVDVHGCEGTAKGTLTVHDLPVVTLDGGNVCPNTPFTLAPVVTTANMPVSYSWASGESTASIQKGAGNYTVTVTDAKNCVNTVSATVVEDPNLTVVIPGPIEICQGEDTLLISNFKAADGYSFVWSQGATPTGDVGESIVVSSTGTYGVAVNKGNCQGAATVDVTVNPLPTVTVDNPAICQGDPAATLTATSATAVGYTWSENGSGTSSTTSGTTAGNYTVIIEDAKGCKDTATGILTVNSLPIVTVNDEVLCAGDPAVTFTATSTTATDYAWSANGTGTNQTTTGTTPGDYTVVVSDINGCKDTATGVLTQKALPIASVNSETICEGDPAATFTATVDSAVATYTWSEEGNGSGITTSGATAGNYTVAVVDVNGCATTATGILTVEGLPVVGNIPASICEGEAANIGEVVQGGSYTYLWTSSTDTENGAVTASISATKGGSYTRVVTSTSPAACVSTSTYVVTEHLKPEVNVPDDTKCDGDQMTLSDTETSAGHSYVWMPGNFTGSSINPTSNNAFTVVKTDDATGCSETTTATATFTPIPNADITPDTVFICEGQTASLSVTHDGANVQWSTGETIDNISHTTEGNVFVAVSNGNCASYDTVYVDVTQYPVSEINKQLAVNPICFQELDSTIIVEANSDRNFTYSWNNGETGNSIGVTSEGNYSVTISNKNCAITDNITFRDYCPWTLFVPNAITPGANAGSGDGLNDVFNAKGTNIVEYRLLIFDRWGLQLYETNSLQGGWDGTYMGNVVQIDVYVYKIDFAVENINGDLERHTRVGRVTVVR